MKTLAIAVCLLLAAEAPASAQAPKVEKLTYAITAPAGSVYKAQCKFRAIKVKQSGLVNAMPLSGKGSRQGQLPTDNARCTLTLVKGAGPVALVIAGKGQRQATSVATPGATGNVAIF